MSLADALARALRSLRASQLGRRDHPVVSASQIIGWWEARRLAFNLIVGAVGAVSGAAILIVALVSELLLGEPIGLPDPPIVAVAGVVVYAILANICYTGGWIAELVVRRAWPEEATQFATSTFTLGLSFAVVVTLMPAVAIVISAFAYAIASR